jgi:sugar (pentulose or hexulose) kinase
MAGLQLHTSRGDIMKGILEGAAFYLKEIIDTLPAIDIPIHEYRPVGGGSKSDSWVQLCADIMGAPFVRPRVSEAGALGAAIMAGVGSGLFASFPEAVSAMVQPERTFEPNPAQTRRYAARFEKYARLEPLLQDYLQELAQEGTESF